MYEHNYAVASHKHRRRNPKLWKIYPTARSTLYGLVENINWLGHAMCGFFDWNIFHSPNPKGVFEKQTQLLCKLRIFRKKNTMVFENRLIDKATGGCGLEVCVWGRVLKKDEPIFRFS